VSKSKRKGLRNENRPVRERPVFEWLAQPKKKPMSPLACVSMRIGRFFFCGSRSKTGNRARPGLDLFALTEIRFWGNAKSHSRESAKHGMQIHEQN
jgi:hypothetical protein